MQIDEDTRDLVFSTGRRVYANRGIVGIDAELSVSEGYDGEIDTDKFTAEERNELADYMIGLWQRFKAR